MKIKCIVGNFNELQLRRDLIIGNTYLLMGLMTYSNSCDFHPVKVLILDIDEFFINSSKYGITESEKETMMKYYKLLPDVEQWEKDKELLMISNE